TGDCGCRSPALGSSPTAGLSRSSARSAPTMRCHRAARAFGTLESHLAGRERHCADRAFVRKLRLTPARTRGCAALSADDGAEHEAAEAGASPGANAEAPSTWASMHSPVWQHLLMTVFAGRQLGSP